jgi:hypothetical protein
MRAGIDDNFARLQRLIAQSAAPIHRVWILHNSGKSLTSLVTKLLKMGCDVEMYLKSPKVGVINAEQSRKIRAEVDDASRVYRPVMASDAKLTIYYYTGPASARFVLVDDWLVAMGWYLYVPKAVRIDRGRGLEMLGEGLPHITAEAGTDDFAALHKMARTQFDQLAKFRGQAVLTLRG